METNGESNDKDEEEEYANCRLNFHTGKKNDGTFVMDAFTLASGPYPCILFSMRGFSCRNREEPKCFPKPHNWKAFENSMKGGWDGPGKHNGFSGKLDKLGFTPVGPKEEIISNKIQKGARVNVCNSPGFHGCCIFAPCRQTQATGTNLVPCVVNKPKTEPPPRRCRHCLGRTLKGHGDAAILKKGKE
jgi:hypothetical protein